MEELSEYKPRDESFLEYRGLSIVFFQIFTFMDECDDCASCKIAKDFRDCKYIKLKSPNEAIDNQIFVYIKNVSPIKKYRLKGFKFKFTLKDEEDEEQEALIISGEMLVEMSIIYNRNVSLSYRMIIDDIETDEDKKANFVRASAPLTTDHLISLIAFFMDAEHWGVEEITCSECGSENIKEITTGKEDDDVRQYYFCNDCGVESYKDFTYGNIAPELEGLEITELFLDSGGVWSDDSEKNIESLKA
ncbi:MAG: hypothetical protein FWB73_05280, partial [Treponema sp.]|nr:hypothetical protein [Treponema sp.]